MIIIKTEKEIKNLRIAGKHLGEILSILEKEIKPGVTPKQLDARSRELIQERGCTPAFLGYTPHGAPRPYPSALCTSVNSEVVHGIPTNTPLKEGDIISIDLGLWYNAVVVDSARTVPVGKISPELEKLLQITRESLYVGIQQAVAGNRTGDIGNAIETFIKPHNYGIVKELAGHGVGREIHEDPYVPNYGKKGTGSLLKENMVIAIEPMINLGKAGVVFHKDGYTVTAKDSLPSAHFEHTVLITKGKPEILTDY
ncbi:MAG: type I methionyl aminopeptidase [Candidatus Pacebacteria bacterium]|nr:type I methionyl aminopeptidase [Candidatus Paceibacterota bacterium]MBP9780663.1 type I methionyl aminopeptidase [Candidatus Paceibacterota bacterium]